MSQHHGLGTPHGPRCENDSCQVFGANLRKAVRGFAFQLPVTALQKFGKRVISFPCLLLQGHHSVGSSCLCAEGYHVIHETTAAQNRLYLRELEDVPNFPGSQIPVYGHHDSARRHNRQVRKGPLGSVLTNERDGVALACSQTRQAGTQLQNTSSQLEKGSRVVGTLVLGRQRHFVSVTGGDFLNQILKGRKWISWKQWWMLHGSEL